MPCEYFSHSHYLSCARRWFAVLYRVLHTHFCVRTNDYCSHVNLHRSYAVTTSPFGDIPSLSDTTCACAHYLLLRFLPVVPSLSPSGKRPKTNQRRTKDEPRMNLRTPYPQKCCLLRLPSLLPLLYLASFHRENSDRRPSEERHNSLPTKVLFLKIAFLKKLTRILKLLTIFLKTFTPFLKRFTPCCAFRAHLLLCFTPNKHKKCTFPQKKCIFLYILTSFSSFSYYLCSRFRKTIANHQLPIAPKNNV